MRSQKKEIFFQKKKLIGQSNRHLSISEKLKIFDLIINNAFMSRAFDAIFNYSSVETGIIEFNNSKVDKNLLDHLMKNNTSNLDDIRSKSQLSRIRKNKSRSRTPLTKKLRQDSIYNLSNQKNRKLSQIYQSQYLNNNPGFDQTKHFQFENKPKMIYSSQCILQIKFYILNKRLGK